MKNRPTSITVIAWIIIVMGCFTLISTMFTLNNPMVREAMSQSALPVSVQLIMMFLGLGVMLVSGIAILKGKNWARVLYVIWSCFGLIVSVVTSPYKTALIPSFVFVVVAAFFLFRAKAGEFFSMEKAHVNEQSP